MSIANKSAFPSWNTRDANIGMTIREEFARSAMAAFISTRVAGCRLEPKEVASESVAYADALIKELAKRENDDEHTTESQA
jgi:hypothetical protein